MGTNELFIQALDLDEKDRATLAGLLIESLEKKPAEEIESVWKTEISRRIMELDSGEVGTIPWEDVKARLLKIQIVAVAHSKRKPGYWKSRYPNTTQ